MPEIRSFHVIPTTRRRWALRRAGSLRALKLFESRTKAWKEGRRRARAARARLYLHNAGGQIISMYDYD